MTAHGCCLGKGSQPPFYDFSASSVGSYGDYDVRWFTETTTATGVPSSIGDLGYIFVSFSGQDPPDHERVLEFYEVSGVGESTGAVRVDAELEWTVLDGDCAPTLIADVRALPHGIYLVVHRRSSAPPDIPISEFPWRPFEGEDALLTWFVIDGE